MKLIAAVVCACVVFQVSEATRVRKCGTTDPPTENANINIPACEKLPCKLKKKSNVGLEFKFTPKTDTAKLTNDVHAMILNVPFPFIGVNGNSVCDKIFNVKGEKVQCPLKGGEEYLYKDGFDVLEIYPKLKTWVKWALVDDKGESVTCIEILVKITS